ncbi:hypothetical protein [Rossellomorea arthrocnemi]|uniref:hypothetical protein n=1 Tax=Rossellomorea arthrocnemi TaxID=2769542 RepID=UPI00191A731E|nr:hypothetical protein [Rossellomorea arthrocnemi]
MFLIIYFILLGSIFHLLFIKPAVSKKVDKQPFVQHLDASPSSIINEAKPHAR